MAQKTQKSCPGEAELRDALSDEKVGLTLLIEDVLDN